MRRMREEQQRLARLGASRPAAATGSAPADAQQRSAADGDSQAPAQPASEADAPATGQRGTESLLQLAAKSRKEKPEETEAEKALKEEQDLLRQTTKQKALQGVQELARVRAPCRQPHWHAEMQRRAWANDSVVMPPMFVSAVPAPSSAGLSTFTGSCNRPAVRVDMIARA